ncbi:sensor histidine kinase [Pseudoalteromonas ulvae]|nr:sensor histidine kinase [Pseudoalteromonas ulvae]
MESFMSLAKQKNAFKHAQAIFVSSVPVLAAIMLEAHIRFLSLRYESPTMYVAINLQLVIECLPFLLAHYATQHLTRIKALSAWASGFIGYPLLLIALNQSAESINQTLYLGWQGWLFCVTASAAWLLSQQRKTQAAKNKMNWFQAIFSLNAVVAILVFSWVAIMAGVLNSHVDPMMNQPFPLRLDLGKIVTQFGQFFHYFWQLSVYGLFTMMLYLFTRYVLIRLVLTQQGVLSFLFSCLLTLIIATPVMIWLLLQLPINDLPSHIANLTPGADHNLFNRDNYQFIFLFLAISSPIILAFERQQHHATINEIANQHTQTELKLLQQQINPHFLFNTLNNLYALTLTKSDDAPELVMQLANLLRYSVYEGQKPQVNLEKDLDYLQNFIALQTIRSGDKCRFITQWPALTQPLNIAPLLLIIILENAIKHGVEPTTEQVTVEFKVTLNANQLSVVCKNPIHSSPSEQVGGLGLLNLKRRLDLLYPNQHTFTQRHTTQYWQTTLTLELTPC